MDSGQAPHTCTVPALKSIRELRSDNKHGIMRLLCDDRRNEVQGVPALAGACGCTLLWIRTELPCMHRVWIGVDSGVPVRKLTRYHMVSCAKTSLTGSRAKFSSRVHLDLEASRIFGTTPHRKIWSNFVQSYFVGEQTLSRGALAPWRPSQ